jgi:hypothetical protein
VAVIVRVVPAGTIFKSQSNTVVQSPAFKTKLKPTGVVSDTRTFLASLEPAFVTRIVKTAFSPGVVLEGGVLTMLRSALETILVGSLALELLGFNSPPPDTLAVLVTLEPMFWATLTAI